MSTERPIAAIDLGGTRMRVALVGEATHILAQRKVATPAEEGPEGVVARMAELVRGLAGEVGREPAAACVAAPGPLDPATGIVHDAPNLSGWREFPLAARLSARLGLPTRANNDASLAALGEALHGAGAGCEHVVYLTVSTGVGGGIVDGGRIRGGSHGLGGELGHVILQAGGPRCGLGHAGCLEALASGTGVARSARRALRTEGPLARDSILRGHAPLDARSVTEAAREGDALATIVLAMAARALGLAVGGLVNTFDPDVVIIGGGLGLGAWDLLFEPVGWHAAKVVMSPQVRSWRLAPAALGDDAGLIGAAAWLRRAGEDRL